MLKYKTVNIAYNNCNVIVSVSAKSNSEKSEREKESDCVKKKKKKKMKVIWMFNFIENKIAFLFLDLKYFVLILFACKV